ncbi:MAG: SRPBCC domain-containing protein [Burkholderiales bacterium]
MEQASVQTKPSLVLHRRFAVAPEKVWRAWTDPQAIAKWWGPGGQDPVSLAELDLRVGGRFRIVFGGPKGTEHECAGIYKEVVPNRRLVFTWCWPNTTPERVSQVTILFRAEAGGTDMEFRHEQFFDEAARDGHRRGWTETFAKLDDYLKST